MNKELREMCYIWGKFSCYKLKVFRNEEIKYSADSDGLLPLFSYSGEAL